MLSINRINFIIFVFLFLNNIFYYSAFCFTKHTNIPFVFGLGTNLFLLILFLIFNLVYFKDFTESKKTIKELINFPGMNVNEKTKKILLKKLRYEETGEIYDLFKNMYIRKNLLLKDYNDLQSLFSKLISGKMLNEVGEKGKERVSLGISTKKDLTVIFIDIIGFTSIAEELTAEKSLLLLNIYFDGIVEIIEENGGYIDKFLGDGIMALFDGEFSDNALKIALEIQKFMKTFEFSSVGKKLSVGIGINSGEVILGTIGAKNRMEISVIGDAVNTASRIEGLTRSYEEHIIIGENTYNKLEYKENFEIIKIGNKLLKGKKKKIYLYAIKK